MPNRPSSTVSTLLDHYEQHGFPRAGTSQSQGPSSSESDKLLTRDTVIAHTSDVVRARIEKLSLTDPYFLSEDLQIEFRILRSLADKLHLPYQTLFSGPPLLPPEQNFLKVVADNTPTTFESLANLLSQFSFAQKEGISSKLRMQIARLIIQLFGGENTNNSLQIMKALTSPIYQKFLTETEYNYIFSNMKKLTMSHRQFETLDPSAQLAFLSSLESSKPEIKDTLHQILTPHVIENMSGEAFLKSLELVVNLQDTAMLFRLMNTRYADSKNISPVSINTIIDHMSAENEAFVLMKLSNFIERIPENKYRAIHWKKIFTVLAKHPDHFAIYWNLFPKIGRSPELWEQIILSAAAAKNERTVREVLQQIPILAPHLKTHLTRIAHDQSWSDDILALIVKPR